MSKPGDLIEVPVVRTVVGPRVLGSTTSAGARVEGIRERLIERTCELVMTEGQFDMTKDLLDEAEANNG